MCSTCTRSNVSVFHVFLTESTRQRAYSLVAQAYTSITAEDFAAFVGYSVEEAVKGVISSREYIYIYVKQKPVLFPQRCHIFVLC